MGKLLYSIVGAAWLLSLGDASAARGEDAPSSAENGARVALTFSCAPNNDVLECLVAGGVIPRRYESPEEAIEHAEENSGVLMMAEGYPNTGIRVSEATLAKAAAKRLRLYVEYPESLPNVAFDQPRRLHWERVVVASQTVPLGLPTLRLLSLHDCHFRPTTATDPILVAARVAGFDRAVYGLPSECFPILFKTGDGVLVATTKLSCFNTARYAPGADWREMWQRLLGELDPAGAPHQMIVKAKVSPAFTQNESLPANAEALALDKAAAWTKNSRLLISAERQGAIHDLLRSGGEEISPQASDPLGDGSFGILEGYASRIGPDGGQVQRAPIRADCQAESAAVLAMHAALTGDVQSKTIAANLLNYLYFDSELHRGVRGDSRHPAFGLVAWGAVAPAWRVANYGDDNARVLLATMLAAASLESDAWDASMLRTLLANLRTTGRLGFRGDRIDLPPLEQHGWQHYRGSDTTNYAPQFEGYLWACYLWAYAHTGEQEFLDKTKIAIRKTMEAYPKGWRWGDNLERGHMLLPLAWLVRVEDTAEHRDWLRKVANDLLADQQPCGAIAERLAGAGAGHYVIPPTNEAYGTSETPLIQENGDPVSDQLYTSGFVLLGLHEAAAAINDPELKSAEDRLAQYLVRIQVRSNSMPSLDGAWFRAFDFRRWDYWASSADMGWGAWCLESGWGPAWTAITLGLRNKGTSLWDTTASTKIGRSLEQVKKTMADNDGQPWK